MIKLRNKFRGAIDSSSTRDFLQGIISKRNPYSAKKNLILSITNIVSILEREKEILSDMTGDIPDLLRSALVASTPTKKYWWALSATAIEDLSNNILQSTCLLSSPLLGVLSSDQYEKLEFEILWFTYRVIVWMWVDRPPNYTANFPALRGVLESPRLRYNLIWCLEYQAAALITWGLLYDISFLSYFQARDLNARTLDEDFWLDYPQQILEKFLEERNIAKAVFWGLVETTPDLPILTVVELLSN